MQGAQAALLFITTEANTSLDSYSALFSIPHCKSEGKYIQVKYIPLSYKNHQAGRNFCHPHPDVDVTNTNKLIF